jgi:hypothetical protein
MESTIFYLYLDQLSQLKVHISQFLLKISLREEIPLPLPHVFDAFFSLFLEENHRKSVPTFVSCSI